MNQKSRRTLADVNETELREAITKMCQELGIPGSVIGSYDLYQVIGDERLNAIERLKNDK